MRNAQTACVGVFMGICLWSFLAWAVPSTIPYQGYLTGSEGTPVDGFVTMGFALYASATPGDQGPLWEEFQTVQVLEGIFSVRLGAMNSLPFGLFDEDEFYLKVTVEGEPLEPPLRLGSTPFAFRAETADYALAVAAGAVDQTAIEAGAVTSDKIASLAVTGDKIKNNIIAASHIQDGAVLLELLDDDGAGSGLDADFLDGLDASAFMRSDVDRWVDVTGDIMSGTLNVPEDGLKAGTDQFVLLGGKVGIGTTAPGQKLHVVGNTRLAADTYQYVQVGKSGSRLQLYLYDGDTAAPTITMGSGAGTATLETGGNMGLNLDVSGAKPLKIRSKNGEGSVLLDRLSVEGGADTASVSFLNSNVGIGTASPTQKLDVTGHGRFSGGDLSVWSGDKAVTVRQDASHSYISNKADFMSNGAGSNGKIVINGSQGISLRYGDAGSAGADGLVLDAAGKVGIGTSSPTQRLEVSGNQRVNGDVTVTGDFRYASPKIRTIHLPPAAFRIAYRGEDENYRTDIGGYGWIESGSGTYDVYLTCPVPLPDGGGLMRSFKVFFRDGSSSHNLRIQAHLRTRALDTTTVNELAFLDHTTSGYVGSTGPQIQSREDTTFLYPYALSAFWSNWVWVRFEVDAPTSALRFYGCTLEYEVSSVW